jgi:hypothetical protein
VYGSSSCDPSVRPTPTSIVVASDDGGATWHDTATGIESQGYSAASLAAHGSTVFVSGPQVPPQACSNPSNPKADIWRPSDGGRTWTVVTTLAAESADGLAFASQGSGSSAFGVVAVGAGDGNTDVPYFTSDSGATWTPLPAPAGLAAFTTFIPVPDGDVLAAVYDGTTNYRVQPTAAAPSWAPLATEVNGSFTVVTANGVNTLWCVAYTYGNPSTVEYLALPA